jgi:hypothetical protein
MSPRRSLGEESLINYLLSFWGGSLNPMVVESAPADKGTQSQTAKPRPFGGASVSFGPSWSNRTLSDSGEANRRM